MNDAVLTIIGGGLRSYLKHHGLLPEKSLIVGVPISIRADDAKEAAGNQAMLAVLPLGTDIADPIERLGSVSDWASAKKEYTKAIPAHRLTEVMNFVPGPTVALAVAAYTSLQAANVISLPYNLIATNVPASRTDIYFARSKMIEYDACGPLWDGAALLHVVTSYRDVVNISFDADKKLLPDADMYCECLLRSKLELLAAAAAQAKAKTKVG